MIGHYVAFGSANIDCRWYVCYDFGDRRNIRAQHPFHSRSGSWNSIHARLISRWICDRYCSATSNLDGKEIVWKEEKG